MASESSTEDWETGKCWQEIRKEIPLEERRHWKISVHPSPYGTVSFVCV
jgi:hypothetical protein